MWETSLLPSVPSCYSAAMSLAHVKNIPVDSMAISSLLNSDGSATAQFVSVRTHEILCCKGNKLAASDVSLILPITSVPHCGVDDMYLQSLLIFKQVVNKRIVIVLLILRIFIQKKKRTAPKRFEHVFELNAPLERTMTRAVLQPALKTKKKR
jgi:hypothetical protein